MASQKFRDGLLYYQGKPSLYYPAVLVENQRPRYPRTLVTDLGMCKILCAVFLFVCGVVSIVSDLSASYGAGIWASVTIFMNGVLAISVGVLPESNIRWVAFFVVTFMCEVSTGLLTVFSTVGLTRSIARSDRFNNKKNLLITVYAILLALALIDSVLSLICFVIAIRRGLLCPARKEIKTEQRDSEGSCLSSVPIIKPQTDGLSTPKTPPYLVNQVDSSNHENETYRALDKRLALEYLEKSTIRGK